MPAPAGDEGNDLVAGCQESAGHPGQPGGHCGRHGEGEGLHPVRRGTAVDVVVLVPVLHGIDPATGGGRDDLYVPRALLGAYRRVHASVLLSPSPSSYAPDAGGWVPGESM